jgi:hypothetical protein
LRITLGNPSSRVPIKQDRGSPRDLRWYKRELLDRAQLEEICLICFIFVDEFHQQNGENCASVPAHYFTFVAAIDELANRIKMPESWTSEARHSAR